MAQVPQQASGGPRRPTGASWNVDGDASIGGRRLRPTVGGPLYVDYDEFPNCGGISFEGPVSDSTKAPVSGPLVGWLAYAKERRSEEERKRRSEEAKRITSEDVKRRGGEE